MCLKSLDYPLIKTTSLQMHLIVFYTIHPKSQFQSHSLVSSYQQETKCIPSVDALCVCCEMLGFSVDPKICLLSSIVNMYWNSTVKAECRLDLFWSCSSFS